MSQKKSSPFWLVGYTLLILMIGTNLPTPLYGVYRSLWGFSSGTLTLIFATYALLLIPSLLLFGQLSDHFGRKKVLLPGLIMAVVGQIVFAFAGNVAWLFIGRGIQGLAVGIISGAATAALAELHPQHDRRLAALIASVATAGGTAFGPIIAGLLAQYEPWPTELSYWVQLILLLPGLIGILRMPETVKKEKDRKWRMQRPSVPSSIRPQFFFGGATAFMAWSVTALFMSLVPSYVSSLMHIKNLAIIGGVVFIMLFASSAVQLILRKLKFRVSMISGLLLLTLGLIGFVCAVPIQSVSLLLISTIVAGIGQGLAFMGSMALVSQVAPPERRGDVTSSFYVVIYLGVGLPILGVGFGAEAVGLYQAVVIFSILIGIFGLLIAGFIGARRRLEESAS